MKSLLLLMAVAALAFSSCTSAYKSTQTPDDVYYSPARPQDEYVRVEKKQDRRYYGSQEYYDDQFLRMRVHNRYRWSVLDDYYYAPSYAYQYYGSSWYNPYNSYWCWNSYYNPYYGGIIIKNPGSIRTPPPRPIAFNPNSYSSGNNNTRAYNRKSGSSYSNSRYNNSNGYNNRNNSSLSNSLQKMFSNSNSGSNSRSSNSSSSSTPTRSYNPSSSSSSSSSSSGGSSSSSSSSGGSRPNR